MEIWSATRWFSIKRLKILSRIGIPIMTFRVSREIGITLAPRHHAERVSIPVGNHCNADLVVVAFATPRVSTSLVAPAQEL
jgi:hypothetical protein